MKSIFRFSYLLVFISFLTSAQAFKDGTVIIAGKVDLKEFNSKVITLSYSNIIESGFNKSIILDTSGRFHFEESVYYPQNLSLRYESHRLTLFAGRGDSLFVQIFPPKFDTVYEPDFQITGAGSRVSTEIQKFKEFQKIKPFKPIVDSKSVSDYHEDLKKHLALEIQELYSFANKYNPSKTFVKYAENEIIYRNANFLVDYQAYGSGSKTQLYDINEFPIDNDEAINTSVYWMHLNQYAIHKYGTLDPKVESLWQAGRAFEASQLILRNICMNEPKSFSRDIMLLTLLTKELSTSAHDFEKLWTEYKADIKSIFLREKLEERYQESLEVDNSSISSWDKGLTATDLSSKNFLNKLKSRHLGRVIYLDFFATWCGPCKAEAPKAYELHEYFEGQEVAFVNLCLESNKALWQKVVTNWNLQGENYHFDNDESRIIQSQLNIFGFPTYMLIDKQGNIVSKNAPRPSSGEVIRTEIERLLAE